MNIDRMIAIIMTVCLALAVLYANWILVGACIAAIFGWLKCVNLQYLLEQEKLKNE